MSSVHSVRPPDTLAILPQTVGNADRVRRVADLFRAVVQITHDFIIPLEGLNITLDILYVTSGYISSTTVLSLIRHYNERDETGSLKILKGCGHPITKLSSRVGNHIADVCDTIKLLDAWKLIELGAYGAKMTVFKHHVAIAAASLVLVDLALVAKRNFDSGRDLLSEREKLTAASNVFKIALIALVIFHHVGTPLFFLTAFSYSAANVTRIVKDVKREILAESAQIHAWNKQLESLESL